MSLPIMARRARKKSSFVGRFLYWVRYRIGEYCLRGFVSLLPQIPHRLLVLSTSAAARLAFVILWKYRQRMEENLSAAMGEEFFTSEKRKAMVWRAWRNFAQGVYETTCSIYLSKERICSTVAIQGEEYLQRALAKGKGAIGLSAHLGNFTMIGIRLAAAGYPFSVVVKQPKDQRFASLIDEYRAMVGIKTISAKPRREAARQILKALRRNEVVLLVADEFKSGGVEVSFLGRMAPAPRGPVTLALRTGAAVLPIFVTRDHEDHLTLSIGSEIDLIKTGDLQDDVAANAGLFTRHLEATVRRYPEQWNWLGFNRDGRRARAQMVKSPSTYANQEDHFSS